MYVYHLRCGPVVIFYQSGEHILVKSYAIEHAEEGQMGIQAVCIDLRSSSL